MGEKLSKELNVKDAAIKLTEMGSPEDILAFISGDDRKTVFPPPSGLRNPKNPEDSFEQSSGIAQELEEG